jgi:iron(III) transport system substrate-binding protein
MMLAKKALKKSYGLQAFTTYTLMVLAVLLLVTSTGMGAGKPKTVAEIALYQGPDREQMLIEGAKKEGKLVFYNSNSWMTNVVSKEFEKKYPFVKVLAARSTSKIILQRVMEEYAAKRYQTDVIETIHGGIQVVHNNGLFQECYLPDAVYYPDEIKAKGKTGVYYLADRELYYGIGFNTEAISPAEAPKNYMDLLDPKWKGKMSIDGKGIGIRWIGHLMHVMGREYIEKLSHQDISVHEVMAAAMTVLVVAGEVPITPTGGKSTFTIAKQKGAPVEWLPLSPALTTIGLSGMTIRAPNPHAAVLFLNYVHSKEGQQIIMKGNLSSPRTDIKSGEQEFKKFYLDSQYPIEVYQEKYSEWEKILRELFVRRR